MHGATIKMNWIHLPQEREKWRAVVNTIMNLQLP
jgi:hypothetical protein